MTWQKKSRGLEAKISYLASARTYPQKHNRYGETKRAKTQCSSANEGATIFPVGWVKSKRRFGSCCLEMSMF